MVLRHFAGTHAAKVGTGLRKNKKGTILFPKAHLKFPLKILPMGRILRTTEIDSVADYLNGSRVRFSEPQTFCPWWITLKQFLNLYKE